ncbi:MAG TPA: hypothetical protein VKM93_07390 [Terriglobia bacterium]|nr:hypothetical protein [Terriglobia bacterium]
MLWQERMLELEYQLKLEQLSPRRRAKATGVTDFNPAPVAALDQLAAGCGSAGATPGTTAIDGGLRQEAALWL